MSEKDPLLDEALRHLVTYEKQFELAQHAKIGRLLIEHDSHVTKWRFEAWDPMSQVEQLQLEDMCAKRTYYTWRDTKCNAGRVVEVDFVIGCDKPFAHGETPRPKPVAKPVAKAPEGKRRSSSPPLPPLDAGHRSCRIVDCQRML